MIGSAKKLHNIYQLLPPIPFPSSASTVCSAVTIKNSSLRHFRPGHLSTPRLRVLQSLHSSIIVPSFDHCHVCHLAKQRKLSFPVSSFVSSSCFDLVHVDLWGPATVISVHGHKYFLTIVDDKSRFTWLFLLKSKADARSCLQNFCFLVET